MQHQVRGSGYRKSLLVPERERSDRVYTVNYYIYNTRTNYRIESMIEWAIAYLMRGSGLMFKSNYNPYDKRILFYLSDEMDSSSFNRHPESQVLRIYSTYNIHDILVLILSALGMTKEHERPDRLKYLDMTPEAQAAFPIQSDSDVVWVTGYDAASIMHVTLKSDNPLARGISTKFPQYKDATSGKRSFLSSCDWYTLQKMYPDLKSTQRCIPGKVEDLVKPSNALIRLFDFNVTKALHTCQYDDAYWTTEGGCRFQEPITLPPAFDKHFVNKVPVTALAYEEILSFCSLYEPKNTSKITSKKCVEDCLYKCGTKNKNIPLTRCMFFLNECRIRR
jgi:hypothetical protein